MDLRFKRGEDGGRGSEYLMKANRTEDNFFPLFLPPRKLSLTLRAPRVEEFENFGGRERKSDWGWRVLREGKGACQKEKERFTYGKKKSEKKRKRVIFCSVNTYQRRLREGQNEKEMEKEIDE